jgi:hypothetical protein
MSDKQTTIERTNLSDWFPHLTKLSDMELAFLLQVFAEACQAARLAGAALADDFLSRWLLILDALMRDKGYATVADLRKALAAKAMSKGKAKAEIN